MLILLYRVCNRDEQNANRLGLNFIWGTKNDPKPPINLYNICCMSGLNRFEKTGNLTSLNTDTRYVALSTFKRAGTDRDMQA